eukprot:9012130-Pyramimonas_sp.AAC.1
MEQEVTTATVTSTRTHEIILSRRAGEYGCFDQPLPTTTSSCHEQLILLLIIIVVVDIIASS